MHSVIAVLAVGAAALAFTPAPAAADVVQGVQVQHSGKLDELSSRRRAYRNGAYGLGGMYHHPRYFRSVPRYPWYLTYYPCGQSVVFPRDPRCGYWHGPYAYYYGLWGQ